ncbi:hypothetical protein SH528x_004396 [Novipirellula sp. SH528]|uniref:hypothetical protein n=1 Tax=Novipirellula sp. SH528 TaxID=3454466 RepID=UPI003F9EC539
MRSVNDVASGNCSCPYRRSRMLLYALAALAIFASVAVRNVHKGANVLANEQSNGKLDGDTAAVAVTEESEVTTFVFEADSGLPCNNGLECDANSATNDSK